MAIQKIPNTLIADNAVTAAKIANGSLTADDIAANSITAAKLSASTSPTFGGLTVTGTGTLTLASNTMTTSADFTIDSAGDINLDAGGSDIKFRGSGLLFGQISRNGGGDFILRSYLSDKDTIFQGNDGGSVITALTLDMSEAGQATFNAGATFGGNVGIGTSDPQKALDIAGASSSGGAVMRLSGTGEASQGNVTGAIQFYSADTTDNTPGVFGMLRGIAGASGGEGSLQILTDMPSEGADASNITMHFNSNGNVGIGTSSPTQKLDVNGNIAVGYDSNSTHQILKTYATNHASGNQGGILQLGIYDGSFAGMKVVNTASSVTNYNSQYISFETHEGAVSVAERMRITSGGTLLLGQTTANANAAVFELTGKNSTQGTIRITPDSNKGSEVSHIHYGSTGDWYIRSASTSGKVIINDGGGNVGIGTASPLSPLQVNVGTNLNLGVNEDSSTVRLSVYNDAASSSQPMTINSSSLRFDISDVEYMRLDGSGHLILGSNISTTEAGKLSVYTDATNDPAIYGYRSTSSFKIVPFLSNGAFSSLSNVNDSGLFFSDNFVIAKHSTGYLGMIVTGNGTIHIGTESEATGSTGGVSFSADTSNRRNLICATTGTGNLELIEFRNPNGTVGDIKSNGTSTSYNTSSDYRLKENVTYEFNALDRVTQLKPARFNFITDADTVLDGFLAHEVSSIVPEAVSGEKDATKEKEVEVTPAQYEDDGETLISEAVMETRTVPVYQGIDQSKLVPLLTKAIQELNTKLEAAEARITELEG